MSSRTAQLFRYTALKIVYTAAIRICLHPRRPDKDRLRIGERAIGGSHWLNVSLHMLKKQHGPILHPDAFKVRLDLVTRG